MRLPPDLVAELISVIRESFGTDLTIDDANDIGEALVDLYHLIGQLKN